MRAAGVLHILLPAQLLIAKVGCGGDTTENQPGLSQGDVSTGGAQVGGRSGGGSVSTAGRINGGGSGGEPGETGGQGGSAGSTGSGGGGGTGGMEPPPYLFGILTLERGPADGYCVQPGNILQGGILYGETGEYSMSGTVFREWDESRPDACWGIQSPDCAISEQFGLTLTATQVAELGALLDALPEDRCELDEMMECDPCVITTVEIGSTTYSDYCCGTQLSPGYDDAFRDLTDFLDGLASNLPCAVADDGCHCLAGATTMAGTTDSCRTDWSCCIHVPMYTDMFDWACDCVNASEAECDQLLADSSSTAFRVSTCPPP